MLFHGINLMIFVVFLIYLLKVLRFGSNGITFRYTLVFYLGFAVIFGYLFSFLFKKKKKEILLLCVSLVLVLLTTESVLRFGVKKKLTYNENLGFPEYQSLYSQRSCLKSKKKSKPVERLYSYDPNSSRVESNVDFTYNHYYNNLGLRDDALEMAKRENEFRIICLGDSYTEGVGAPQDSSWVALLEKQLQSSDSTQFFNCINGGKAGADPIYNYINLKERLIRYHPNLILLTINNTDFSDLITRNGFDRIVDGKVNERYGPWWEPLYATSFIFRHIAMDRFHVTFQLLTPKQLEKRGDKAYELIEESINKTAKLAKENHSEFAVIFHPAVQELYARQTMMDYFVQHLMRTYDYKIIYLLPCLSNKMAKEGKEPQDYFWLHDRHFNCKGYELFATCVFEEISQIAFE